MNQQHLGKADTAIMAAAAALMVANIYYCQPLVVLISKDSGLLKA